jgi:hypothetical protein
VLPKTVITQPEAGGRPVGSCGEGEVVHVGDGLAGVVEAVAALPAGTEDLVVPHPGEGVPDGPPRPRSAQPDRESRQAFASAVVPGTGRAAAAKRVSKSTMTRTFAENQ